MYCLRFMGPPQQRPARPWNAWSNLKKRMAEAHPNVWFERAIRKLADPEWRTENNAPVVFHADLVPVHRAEGGIGNPDGPHIRLEGTHWMMHNLWNDIVFELRGEGWTPDLVLPYKTALEEVFVEELGYKFDCALEVGGEWAYCR